MPVHVVGTVADVEDLERGLLALPDHMREAVRNWVLRGEPHPRSMGHFFQAVLSNNFGEAVTSADGTNSRCLRQWALFLYNDVPSSCWGSMEKMIAWYARLHRDGDEP